jgi:hypothetical protein
MVFGELADRLLFEKAGRRQCGCMDCAFLVVLL